MSDYKYPKTKRLGKDNYKRPRKTATDLLTLDKIEELLEDYVEVDNLFEVPLGTHMRYILNAKIPGKAKFRYGGKLSHNKELKEKGYVMFNNGSVSWSVQVKGTQFYRRLTMKEIRNDYEQEIDGLEEEVRTLKKRLGKCMERNKILVNQLNKYKGKRLR
uniref:Uncharacterized protein n=1 Tax=Mimivirus LCMiAC02 TaxID=2506609 RepID=A0A481Z251_9VIRU|nr:MAG: uncharacterized protein LCMiAC02_02610 [Mimivirus LCMiAC02]